MQLFHEALRRPTTHQGPVFFAVASHVLETGILIITDDRRSQSSGLTTRTVADHGTQDYEQVHGPLRLGERQRPRPLRDGWRLPVPRGRGGRWR